MLNLVLELELIDCKHTTPSRRKNVASYLIVCLTRTGTWRSYTCLVNAITISINTLSSPKNIYKFQ